MSFDRLCHLCILFVCILFAIPAIYFSKVVMIFATVIGCMVISTGAVILGYVLAESIQKWRFKRIAERGPTQSTWTKEELEESERRLNEE